VLVYRTGAYAPNGIPFANGYVDYLKLVNAQGGINGVKLSFEECETGYATDKGVECYERLKSKNGGATLFQPLSTGITFRADRKGPGRQDSADHRRLRPQRKRRRRRLQVELPLAGTYWVAGRHPGPARRQEGGRLRQAEGQEDHARLPRQPVRQGADRAAPGARQDERLRVQLDSGHASGGRAEGGLAADPPEPPDYVFLWGWGVMNSTALKEAVATGFPRDKMYGVWWAAAEPDTKDVGDGAKGYHGLALQHGAEPNAKVVKDVMTLVHGKGQGTGPKEEVGTVLYMRG
jgi:branched-chain amino acid transport system substrate-binding protein